MENAYSRSGDFLKTLATAIVIVTVTAVVLSAVFKSPTQLVEVTDCKLVSENANMGQKVPITVSLQSNDDESSHNIRIELVSHSLVGFSVGSRQLLTNGNAWYYDENLDSETRLTNQINVTPFLEEGVSRITYRIDIAIYSDGVRIFTRSLDLLVQRP